MPVNLGFRAGCNGGLDGRPGVQAEQSFASALVIKM
jgi:hypothetical protein